MQRFNYVAMSVLVIAGCASSQANREPTTPAPAATSQAQQEGTRGDMKGMCPMEVEGTAVNAEDVEGGVALTFTTSTDVAELRRRVAHMAQMHGQHGMGMHASAGAGDGHAHDGQPSDASPHRDGMMAGGMMMPAATARSEEVEGGARILLTPQDTADLEKLREHARHMTGRMSPGRCPMKSMHDEAAAPPPAASGDHDSHRPTGKH